MKISNSIYFTGNRKQFKSLKKFVWRNNISCGYCGNKFARRVDITNEHVDDLFHGGKDVLSNVIAAHEDCNLNRGCIPNTIYYARNPEIPVNLFNYVDSMRNYRPFGIDYSGLLCKRLVKIISKITLRS